MTMEVAQARLPDGLMKKVDSLVEKGEYSNRSDVIRDAVRKLLEKQIGSIPNTGDSVKEVREIRKRLSKEVKSFKDIEKLNEL